MLEVDVYTDNGIMGRGAAPTGTSVGIHESFILRDHDPNEYDGMSVHQAVRAVEEQIAPALIGMDVTDQRAVDTRMIQLDGTEDKHILGGNSIYSVSIACLRAAAAEVKQPVYRYLAGRPLKTIPLPTFNIVNGGRYPDLVQGVNEFILAPWKAECVEQAVEIAVKVYQKLEEVISDYLGGRKPALGGSYGWAAPSSDPAVILELMTRAAEQCGYGDRVAFCLDCASSEMYNSQDGTYEYNGRRVSEAELVEHMEELTRRFPLIFVEDLLDEDAWSGYEAAHQRLRRTNLIGDDFIATSLSRLQRAYDNHEIDGFILKPNQVGSITEALDTYRFAQEHGLLAIPSGRSGGAVGDIVADLCLGLETLISKNGAPKSGERLDKINSLLRASSENPGSCLADCSRLARF